MRTQTSELLETLEVQAWIRLLRAHAALTRRFSADLAAAHGLTLNDYDVLVQLAHADGGRLRRVDLAERVLLTPSGITRLLEGLQRAGWVERVACASDGRVSYAQLTDTGRAKLREASKTHLEAVRALFAERFADDDLAELDDLLARLPGTDPDSDCA